MRRLGCPALLLSSLLAAPAPAAGQTNLQPFDGLFPGLNSETARQRLDLTFAASESYDSDIKENVAALVPGQASGLLTPGYSSLLVGGINYRRHRRTEFRILANSAVRYSPDIAQIQNVGQTAGLLLTIPLPARTTFTATENGAYAPALLQGLFPAQGIGVDPSAVTSISHDYAARQNAAYYATTTLALAHAVSHRARLEGSADYQYNNYPDVNGNRRQLTIYGARADFSRNFGIDTFVRAGYHYRTGEYGFQNLGTTSEHGVEVSVENSRHLSARRRVTFGLTVGASTIGTPSGADLVGATVQRRYPFTGEARFALQFQRSWQFRTSYARGLQYVGEVAEPVVADRLGFALDGLLSRRTDFQASAAYSNGDGALITGTRFKSYTGDIRWRGTLTGTLATFIEGYTFVYDFHGAPIELGLPPRLNHFGARAGLMLWLPAIGRGR